VSNEKRGVTGIPIASLFSFSYHQLSIQTASPIAVSSRTSWNRQIAVERMRELGAIITTTEMALFEIMRIAEGQLFRDFIKEINFVLPLGELMVKYICCY
jgi:hypothetical protein